MVDALQASEEMFEETEERVEQDDPHFDCFSSSAIKVYLCITYTNVYTTHTEEQQLIEADFLLYRLKKSFRFFLLLSAFFLYFQSLSYFLESQIIGTTWTKLLLQLVHQGLFFS